MLYVIIQVKKLLLCNTAMKSVANLLGMCVRQNPVVLTSHYRCRPAGRYRI
jgi:hypothetical protein